MKETIVRYIQQQKGQAAAQAYYDKLKADAKVEILLPPYRAPRQQVEAKGPSRGPANAPVTIVEFSDFECPYCSRAEETVSEVMRVYGDKIRLVFRDLPLPNHQNAPKAAEAAHCAGEQGKYWEMHAKLFANQRALEVPSLKGYAKDLKLDQATFDKCLDSGATAALVEASKKAGERGGRERHPGLLRERDPHLRRAALRGLQGSHRRRAGAEVGDSDWRARRRPAKKGWAGLSSWAHTTMETSPPSRSAGRPGESR